MNAEPMENVEDSAYAILKAMTSDEELRRLAKAVADAGIPGEAVTQMYLGRLIYNRQLYTGYDDLSELIAGTTRKGLYSRPLSKRAKARVGKRTRSRESRVAAPVGDVTRRFAAACELVRPSCHDMTFAPFNVFMRRGHGAWEEACSNVMKLFGKNSTVESAVREALAERRARVSSGGERALAVVPIDRYLADILSVRPYAENMRALDALASATRANLQSPPVANGSGLKETELPVGGAFRRHMLSKDGERYEENYFSRHQLAVWGDMTAAWAFSMAGRTVDPRARARDLISAMSRDIDGDLRQDACSWMPNGALTCVLRDSGPDTFGYRTAVFAVYDAERAERLAVAAAAARAKLIGRNSPKADAATALLSSELAVHGSSLTSEIAVQDMRRFARLFGKWMLW